MVYLSYSSLLNSPGTDIDFATGGKVRDVTLYVVVSERKGRVTSKCTETQKRQSLGDGMELFCLHVRLSGTAHVAEDDSERCRRRPSSLPCYSRLI